MSLAHVDIESIKADLLKRLNNRTPIVGLFITPIVSKYNLKDEEAERFLAMLVEDELLAHSLDRKTPPGRLPAEVQFRRGPAHPQYP